MQELTLSQATGPRDKWTEDGVLLYFASAFKYKLFQQRPEPCQICDAHWKHVGFVIPFLELQEKFIRTVDELYIDPGMIETPYEKTVIVWPAINGVFWTKVSTMLEQGGFYVCADGFVNKIASKERGI